MLTHQTQFINYNARPAHLQLVDAKLERKFDLVLDAVGLILDPFWLHCESFLAPTGTFVTSMHGPSDLGLKGWGQIATLVWRLRPGILGGVRRKYSAAGVSHKLADLQQLADWLAEGENSIASVDSS